MYQDSNALTSGGIRSKPKWTDHRLDRKSLLSYLQTQGAQTNDKRLKLPGQLTGYSTKTFTNTKLKISD
jgi:hypothetical protein